jgi:hypothetical protein
MNDRPDLSAGPGAKMHFWDAYWDLRTGECPCDVHFVAWLKARGIRGASIFHFGTGGHHHVGIETARDGSNNAVLGITAAPQEYDSYVKLAIETPEVARAYKVFFGDIYQLDARLLPTFDIVTLFHLGEFRTEKNDAYGALTDLEVATLLFDRLNPGGRILTYTGSYAFDVAERDMAALATIRPIKLEESYEKLLVFRRTD